MNDLVVNSQLTAAIVDDEDTDASAAIGKGFVQSSPQSTLVNNGKTLLDITSLGHGNNAAVVTAVEDTVLLEHRAGHVLDDDRGSRVGNEARLLVELLAEEIDTQVAVLAGLSGRGDANDLAGTTLEDQDIADTDVMARNGDGVWHRAAAGGLGSIIHVDIIAFIIVEVTHLDFTVGLSVDGSLGLFYFELPARLGFAAWRFFGGVAGLRTLTIFAFGDGGV